MDLIALRYKRRAERYPDENEEERWNGVALDCYLRTGHVPDEVLRYKALASAGLYSRKYRDDQPRVPEGNPDGGQWTAEGGGQSKPQRSRLIQIAGDIIEVCVGYGFSHSYDDAGISTGLTIYYECRDGYTFSRMSNRRIGVVPDPRKWRKL